MMVHPPRLRPYRSRYALRGPVGNPTVAKVAGIGGAVAGAVVGGWLGKKVGWVAGTIGGAASLGLLAWAYFSGKFDGGGN